MAGNFPPYAWMNGEVIPWENAKIHIRTDAVMRGASVFEGIRAYASPDRQQLYVFKSAEHMDRFYNTSMKILRMKLKWTPEELTQGMLAMLRANEFHGDVHIRPQAYFGLEDEFRWDPDNVETGCGITAIQRDPKPSLWNGINACISSWRRIDDQSVPPRVKGAGNYINSRYITMQAKLDGYNTAIVMNHQGKVSEGPGACLMMVRNGKVVTPPVTAGILESVTRAALIQLFPTEMGMEVVEREIDRTELYIADEVFFCGTGAEVQPIVSIDKYPVGSGQTGPVVKKMQEVYFGIARGQNPKYSQWLIPVY